MSKLKIIKVGTKKNQSSHMDKRKFNVFVNEH